MERRVFIESGDWGCCGDPFAVGDMVTWRVSSEVWREGLSRAFGSETAAAITHTLDLHTDHKRLERVTGTVSEITAAFSQTAPVPGAPPGYHEPVPGTAVFERRSRTDWSERAKPPLSWQGYVVTLV